MSIVLTDFKYGKIFISDKDVFIGKVLSYSGQYCDEEVELFRQILLPSDNVIEVGANIGSLSIPISQIIGDNGTLYAIEPQQYIYNMLCANIAVNNLNNVKPRLAAIGATDKDVFLPKMNYELISNFGGVSIVDDNIGDGVHQHTLDDLFSDLTHLKLIKIDVEGMEPQVLNGGLNLIKTHRPFIYCENDRPENSLTIIKILSDLNYNVYEHVSHVYNKSNHKQTSINPFNKDYICINIIAIPSELNLACSLKSLNQNSQ